MLGALRKKQNDRRGLVNGVDDPHLLVKRRLCTRRWAVPKD